MFSIRFSFLLKSIESLSFNLLFTSQKKTMSWKNQNSMARKYCPLFFFLCGHRLSLSMLDSRMSWADDQSFLPIIWYVFLVRPRFFWKRGKQFIKSGMLNAYSNSETQWNIKFRQQPPPPGRQLKAHPLAAALMLNKPLLILFELSQSAPDPLDKLLTGIDEFNYWMSQWRHKDAIILYFSHLIL